ncbi:50S ribosomal protein L18 [Candidatus Shikimatogenerans bostrichidophilus]|uniref:50S ribosomal protein L18 n=1 Tax=Candidatus Shikimatogenerans bostrichidophilus TaxID=2943807 RepID=UPI0029672A4A
MKGNNRNIRNMNIPRLSVFRSNKEIYVQIIDDINQITLISYSSIIEKKKNNKKMTKSEMSNIVGKKIAEKMLKLKIKKIFVDIKKYRYKGRIKILIEAIRKNGIKI